MRLKNVKFASLALAIAISASTITPAFAESDSSVEGVTTDTYSEVLEEETSPRSLSTKVLELKEKAEKVKGFLDGKTGSVYLDAINKIIKYVTEFSVNNIETAGPKIELASDALEAILTATRDLTNKTEKTHREIGFAVTKATVILLNPFAKEDRINEASIKLDEVIETAWDAPDITEDDIATVYSKEKLRNIISEAREFRLKNMNHKKYSEVKKDLNSAITEAVGVQLKNKATVKEVNLAYEKLSNKLLEVKESQKIIQEEIESEELIESTRDEAYKYLLKVSKEHKRNINKIVDASAENKKIAKEEVDHVLAEAKMGLGETDDVNAMEEIKLATEETINRIYPRISEDVEDEDSTEEVVEEDIGSNDEVIDEEENEDELDYEEEEEIVEEEEENLNESEESLDSIEE